MKSQAANKVKILNIEINSFDINQLIGQLSNGFVVTPNIDHLRILQEDENFYKIYRKADYVVCDSQVLRLISIIFGWKIRNVIRGSDLLPAFYYHHKNDNNTRIFLLGGKDSSAQVAMEKINKKVGREIVVGAISPSMGFENKDDENKQIIKEINESGANVLAVGVGAPKQEKWIARYSNQLKNINIFFAVGASIEFEAGTLKRAPVFFRKLGLEWLYRLKKEPNRLCKRYLKDVWVIYLLVLFKINKYKNPFNYVK